jgi:nucleotide-binding universal stress UspA family protein
MSRDRELPGKLTTLNRFGMPWMALLLATLAPVAVLSLVGNNLGMLADLYAIGVVGAIAINLLACGTNRKLELRHWERVTLLVVGSIAAVVELTIAVNKPWALLYACVVLGVGLTARWAAKFAKARRKPVVVPALALAGRKLSAGIPRILVPTRGSPDLIRFAADYAAKRHGAVMALFVREVALTFRERDKPLAAEQMTLERDREALAILQEADNICNQAGVKLFPMYVVHDSPAEIILDYAATYGVDALVMGVSRRGPVWRTFHGDVMREVMQYLPENIPLIIHS